MAIKRSRIKIQKSKRKTIKGGAKEMAARRKAGRPKRKTTRRRATKRRR